MFSLFKSNGDEEFPCHNCDKPDGLDVGLWVGRIVGWDGLLPVAVFSASAAVATFFLNNDGIQVIALLAVPFAAFFWRAYVGRRQINANNFGLWIRRAQHVAL